MAHDAVRDEPPSAAYGLEELPSFGLAHRLEMGVVDGVIEDVAVVALGVSVMFGSGHGDDGKPARYRDDGLPITAGRMSSNHFLNVQ